MWLGPISDPGVRFRFESARKWPKPQRRCDSRHTSGLDDIGSR